MMLRSNYDNRLAGVGVGAKVGAANGKNHLQTRFQIEAAEYVPKILIRRATVF